MEHPEQQPLISIGVPVYNGEKYLPLAVESILSQTYSNVEIIISDNASEDGTVEVMKSLEKADSRVRTYLSPVNKGASFNYNFVFEQARGTFFKWAAADDLLAPTFISRCADALLASPESVLSYPSTAIIDPDGNEIRRLHEPLLADSADPIERFRAIRWNLKECNAVFGLIRRDVLAKTPLIAPYITADAHLLAELALHGPIREIDEVLFFRREHSASYSCNIGDEIEMEFYDPSIGERPVMSYWRALSADMRGIFRSPCSFRQKLALFGFVAKTIVWERANYLYDVRKASRYWKHMARAKIGAS